MRAESPTRGGSRTTRAAPCGRVWIHDSTACALTARLAKPLRRAFLRAFGAGAAAAAMGACAPKTVLVEKEVTREVEKVVKETVVVEGEPVEVTKVVKETVVVKEEVEKEVTRVVAPEPEGGEIVGGYWIIPILLALGLLVLAATQRGTLRFLDWWRERTAARRLAG